MISTPKKLVGATIAAAVALNFSALPITSVLAAETTQVKCEGINGCKSQSACKTAHNACKGHNHCKGKGIMMKPSNKECMAKGGHVMVENNSTSNTTTDTTTTTQ